MFKLIHFLTSTASSASSSDTSAAASEETVEFSWENFWNTVATFFRDNVWTIIAWFLTLVIGVLIIYFLAKFLRYVMRKREVDEMAIRFIVKIVKFFLWLVLIIVLLAIMGVPVTGITTAFSAVVLAIGMALKDFLSHVAAGIILVVSHNYKKGDYIQVNGLEGSIVDINFLFTTLKTYDSTRVTVPNSMMVNNCVTNLEALGVRRLTLHFPIAHDADLDVVRPLLVEVMKSNGRIKLDPAPFCRLNGINKDCLDLFCACYVDIEDYWDMYFYVWDQGYDALKRAGIRIPYQKVSVYQGEDAKELPIGHKALPQRVEKARSEDKIYHLNMFDYDEMSPEQVAEIMAHNKKVREKQKAAKSEAKKKKTAAKSEEKKKADK